MLEICEVTPQLAQATDFASKALYQLSQEQQLLVLKITGLKPETMTKLALRSAQLDAIWLADTTTAEMLLTLPALRLLTKKWLHWFPDAIQAGQALSEISAAHTVIWQIRDWHIDLSQKALVYGIMNITPDSFFDGGKYQTEAAVLAHVAEMVAAGVDVIEVNGQTTRPGFVEVKSNIEIKRTIPYIKAIKATYPDILVAIDTYKLPVMQAAIEAGVDIINDVNGFSDNPAKLELLATSDVGVLTMLNSRQREMVALTPEMHDLFAQNLSLLTNAGIERRRIALDQGIGYANTPHSSQDYGMMLNINKFNDFKRPMMIAISRKGYLGKLLELKKEDRLNMTLVTETMMYLQGAHIIRVHDVLETRQMVTLLDKIKTGYWLPDVD